MERRGKQVLSVCSEKQLVSRAPLLRPPKMRQEVEAADSVEGVTSCPNEALTSGGLNSRPTLATKGLGNLGLILSSARAC